MIGLISVVINNRNLLTWPKAMVERIERFASLADIIIIDNGSTYEPLFEWYQSIQHKVVRTTNLGHKAPWVAAINSQIKTDLYAVTDPDLDLAETPADCLEYLAECLGRFPWAKKIGLGLDITKVPPDSPYFAHVNSYEKAFWDSPLVGGRVRVAPVDTTFAIYDKAVLNAHAVTGTRTDAPYVAGHRPWHVVRQSAEFQQYVATANESCSYKTFVSSLKG